MEITTKMGTLLNMFSAQPTSSSSTVEKSGSTSTLLNTILSAPPVSASPADCPLTPPSDEEEDSTKTLESFLEELFPSFKKSQQNKSKMYEQTLDPEYFHPAFTMYHNEPKFYDDFNQINSYMKNPSALPNPTSTHHFHNALPTPPATPDKVPMSYGNFPHPVVTSHMTSQSYLQQPPVQHQNHFSPNGDMQVVPDFFGKDDENIQQDARHQYSNPIEDPYTNTTYIQIPQQHANIEMPDIGAKRVYSSINNPPPMEFYMNNNYMSQSEAAYTRQFAYENAFNSKRPRFDSSDSLEPDFSRAQHNVLERQRRNDLKLRFKILRDNLPELANNEKAPKIQILKKALTYLATLKRDEQMMLADKELERQKKIILIERLKLLQCS